MLHLGDMSQQKKTVFNFLYKFYKILEIEYKIELNDHSSSENSKLNKKIYRGISISSKS